MSDLELIKAMGGPTKFATELGFGRGGAQRVANWMKRGIPSKVKLDHATVIRRAQKRATELAKGV